VPQASSLLPLILVSVAAHIALAGARVTTSLYALSLHASEFTVGLLIALFSLFPMLLAVPMGRLIDRIGLQRPMLAGCTVMCIGCGLPAALPGLPILYIAVILIGTGFMTVQIASQHTVGAMSMIDTRSGNFGWLALGYSISSFSGPMIAGLIIDHSRHGIAYTVFFCFAVIALLMIACGSLKNIQLASEHDEAQSNSTLDLLRNPDMRGIYLIGILLSSAWDLFVFVIPIHGTRLGFSAFTIGLVLGCFSAATFTIRLMMPWIVRRHSEWKILTAALAVAVVCYLLFPFMRHPQALMALAALLGLAVGSSQSNVLTLLHNMAPTGRTAEAVGIRSTIGNACQVILPVAFGAAGATLGLYAVFWTMGAAIGSGLPLAWRHAVKD
jgi:MFS family permease